MKGVPTDIGTVHFVGIGGIGMSGIAEVMKNLGYSVQGSDLGESATVERLRARGITVHIGQRAENVEGAGVVVTSTAVKRTNPEVVAALEARIPVVRRAEMLAELMRLKNTVAVAGTHGKTTTTSMIAALLDAGGVDPTVINGGVIEQYGSNARLGDSDWMVVEADESDGSFLRLDGTIAVVTNIDPEHLDHYGDFDAVRRAFVEFIHNVPFYGAAVLCIDHPEVQAVMAKVRDRKVVTYGLSLQADVCAVNVTPEAGGNRFDVIVRRRGAEDRRIADVRLPMPGRHNVQNALAAIAVALEMECPDDTIRSGFAQFEGVRRRFTRVGEVAGATVIDDYAHHPVEIRAVLAAARESAGASGGRVIAVVQPHRFTRLRDLMDDFQNAFNDADKVYVAPVYTAGEEPIAGVSSAALVAGLKSRGHRFAAPGRGPGRTGARARGRHRPGRFRGLPRRGRHHPVGRRARRRDPEGSGMSPQIGERRGWSHGSAPFATVEEARVVPFSLEGIRGKLTADAPLAPLVWFKSGGNADWLFEPADLEDLREFLSRVGAQMPVMALGLGSNLIVRDGGVPGVVIRLGKAFATVEARRDRVLECGGGASGILVSSNARDAGVAGVEFLRGIPGTVGGFVRMNGGAYGREVADVLIDCDVVLPNGEFVTLPARDLEYSYRHSNLPEGAVVVAARFQGREGIPAEIGAEMDKIAAAREASQPLRTKTGGSTFKNPARRKGVATGRRARAAAG